MKYDSVLGAVLIVFALYLVLWGKGKEIKKNTQHGVVAPSQSLGDQRESIGIIIVAPTTEDKKTCTERNSSNGSMTIVAPKDLSNTNSFFEKEHHEDNDPSRKERQ